MVTPTQKDTAQAILNIFETGSVPGDYGTVTLIPGDTGRLTFGRSQTTLASGNLEKLIQRYCDNPGARFATKLRPHLPRFSNKEAGLDRDGPLHNLLRASADDPVMRDTQDAFFDETYWHPAIRSANSFGISSPLGVAVVYDSTVHGSWKRIREVTTNSAGTISAVGEKVWLTAYVDSRRSWLAGHARKDLRATVYRMDAFSRLIQLDQWGLELPLVVRGLEISMDTLNATPPGCYDGPQPGSRQLSLQTPLARGLDVRLVQLGLSFQGADVKADGVFGRSTRDCVKTFQRTRQLPATGVADAALIATLIE